MRPTLGVVLVVVIALVAAGVNGEDISSMHVVLEDDHDAPGEGLLVVGGGTALVPAGTTHDGPVYVVAGEARIDGRVTGNLVVVSGGATLGDGAAVGGDLEVYGGRLDAAAGATVEGRRQEASPLVETATDPSPVGMAVSNLLLALAGMALVRWRPALLANVGRALLDHPVVSLTVGGTAATVAVAVLVLMAFTIVLIPVTILGAVAGLVVVTYGTLAYGYLLGTRLPVERPPLATGAGVLGVGLLLDVLPLVPVVGDLATLAAAIAGVGAVLVTYFGVVPFEPPSLA